jgi:zinc protease
VRTHELATDVEANNSWGIDPDLFSIYAQARPGKTVAELERRIDAVVGRLAVERVPEEELRKAKNVLAAELVKNLKTVGGKANQLCYFQTVFGDWRALLRLQEQWEAVSAADVQRVAAKYLQPTARTVAVLEPVASGRPAREGRPTKGAVS